MSKDLSSVPEEPLYRGTRSRAADSPRVNISVDVDTLRYYANFAPRGTVITDRIMSYTVPRMLDLFAELGIHATFFVIGETVHGNEVLWRTAAEAGHEVASHSHTHIQAFFTLSHEQKRAELHDSKQVIEDCTGMEVVGFRAPAYNFDVDVLELLLENGYRYDSSFHPKWFVLASKWVTRIISPTYQPIPTSPIYWRHWRLSDSPFRWALANGDLLEIPLSTTAFGKPFVGTVHLSVSRRFFLSEVKWLRRHRSLVLYELHPIEVVDEPLVQESPWVRNIPGVGRHSDPWEFLRFRLQALKALGRMILLRHVYATEAKVVHPRA